LAAPRKRRCRRRSSRKSCFTPDAAGQPTSRTDYQVGIDNDPWTLNYTHDGQGQLTGDGVNTYDYDEGGNRDTGYTYVRNDADSADTNMIEDDGTWAYSYDGEGNIVKKSLAADDTTWIYEFDHANHLVLAQKWTEDPESEYYGAAVLQMEAEYRYDLFGSRIEKTVADTGVGEYVGNKWENVLGRFDIRDTSY